jgi:hypothetical protein
MKPMRLFASCVSLSLLLSSGAAYADPPRQAPQRLAVVDPDRVRVGAALHWLPEGLGRRLGLGVGWSLPQRWYDTDGQLLTERSLLTPGDDLERSGLYLALRF